MLGDFVGERLQVAREFRGLTQTALAKQVLSSKAMISLLEGGHKKEPTEDLVAAFGEVLGFESGFFHNTLEDPFLENECSFRHRRSTTERLKAQIRAHGTLLGIVVSKLKTKLKFPSLNVPVFPAETFDEVEHAAEKCRVHWNLGLDGPLLEVGRVLEHAGVIILPHLADTKKVDAFSRNGATAVVFLNKAIPSPSRWIFDVGHECGHLVMHSGIETGTIETEGAADRFASAFLMPRRSFEREFKAMNWGHLFDLKRRWRVSAAAIVRRAYDLSLVNAVEYRRAYQYMAFKGWNKGEPCEPSFRDPELLKSAFSSLGKETSMSVEELRSSIHFTRETFKEVTGLDVPPTERRKAEVLQFRISEGD